jgi:hypothetical protein
VLLKSIPLRAPARTLFAASCFPRIYPIVEFTPLYTNAMTPAELPRKGPLRVTAFRTELSLSLGGADVGNRFNPSARPHAPPKDKAVRYVTPVP